ncbi:hypothetical protein EHQ53_14050 [Leptospira langatensis]|uniref:Phage capsid protein n=1 Tax=Leptospira langatensis TaxID=2484983 RepID=A0ABY2M992_9LEPT|nr:hypothetical protein [Leptospira langatensis]TGL39640.1 hypothetical protein EHQ53_14050 [Leptospira langatensis]
MFLDRFNRMTSQAPGQTKELLRKALTSAANSGAALIPQHLERIITNTIIKLSPTIAMIKPEWDAQKLHEFNQIVDLGGYGGAMGEGAVTGVTNSTYTRNATVNLKVIRRKGFVTDFEQEAAERYIDALATEIENQVRAQVYSLEFYLMSGNADSNAYEFSGWDKFIVTNRINNFDPSTGAPKVPSSLQFLDVMIDRSNRSGGTLHDRAFIMTPEMLSKVSQLLTNVRLNQGLQGDFSKVEVNGGWRLNAYRDVPIIQSTYCSGYGASTMGTVTATSGGTTGGSFSDGTYYFRVAALTTEGEQMASAQSSVTLSGGTSTQKITLSFTAVANALSYKVYYGSTTGLQNSKLIDWVPAYAYDGNGTVGAAITSISVLSSVATSKVTGLSNDLPLTPSANANAEIIMLVDFDKYQGMGKFAYNNPGGREGGIISTKPLYNNDAGEIFLVYTHGALVNSFDATSVISRGWVVA